VSAIATVAALNDLGRIRLSQHFYMRDFLFSDIAAVHGFINVPDDPELAIAAGKHLCEELLEPLQAAFGRIAIRSAYRSCEVNGFGNAQQKAKIKGYNCAENGTNYAGHIWDRRDAGGRMGATACIVIPEFVDAFPEPGDWTRLAWWIHDNLPYSSLEFFSTNWAFNIQWREAPERRISSFAGWQTGDGWKQRGTLTKAGMDNHGGDHRDAWESLARAVSLPAIRAE
jgi:hypothetical protein